VRAVQIIEPGRIEVGELSAAATMAALPVVIAGWLAQKQLVRGLSMGAIKRRCPGTSAARH
jgi:ABC-type glycerol-3-phosphate transport system permease component